MNRAEKHAFDEQIWWNEFGCINERLWRFTPFLFNVVRKPYMQELTEFLYKPDGRLLDFGCGSGWVSLPLAQKGMEVRGIDTSSEQIFRAKRQASRLKLSNAIYAAGTVELLDKNSTFDSAIVHCVLHHLSDEEKREALENICQSLCKGGRLFIFEPMAHNPQRPFIGALFDRAMIAFFRILEMAALELHLFLPVMEKLKRNRWKNVSPGEAPILLKDLLAMVPGHMVLKKYTYWHAYSNRFATFCMQLKRPWRKRLEKFICFFGGLDRLLLNSSIKDSLKAWPMASFLYEKKFVG